MSHDEIERQNYSLSLRTIYMSGNEKVPLLPLIIPGNLIQAVIDNFNHKEEEDYECHHTLVDDMIP